MQMKAAMNYFIDAVQTQMHPVELSLSLIPQPSNTKAVEGRVAVICNTINTSIEDHH